MEESRIKGIRALLYIIAIVLTLILAAVIIGGISEYREGMRGFSYGNQSVDDLERELNYGEYDWVLRELKGDYRCLLGGPKADDYSEIRNVAEYYQWSIIARSYYYVGDIENATYFAVKAADCVSHLGQYLIHQEGIDNAISDIGD